MSALKERKPYSCNKKKTIVLKISLKEDSGVKVISKLGMVSPGECSVKALLSPRGAYLIPGLTNVGGLLERGGLMARRGA